MLVVHPGDFDNPDQVLRMPLAMAVTDRPEQLVSGWTIQIQDETQPARIGYAYVLLADAEHDALHVAFLRWETPQ